MSYRSHYLTCAGREIHLTEWGHASSPVVVAWHGLARTGRDMDELAQHLSRRYRVICPDMLGRGLSQWSPEPVEEYQLAFYARIAQELFDGLSIAQAHWVGTSMGGAVGMVAASGLAPHSLKGRIKSLLLNDNAPELAAPAVARIKAYAGTPPAFDTMGQLEQFFRQVYQPYGWLSDTQWRRLTETSARRLPNGQVTPHYDPAIAAQFHHHPDDYSNWQHWDALDIPVLCLRGESSDLVLRETTAHMLTRGPGSRGLARVIEVPGCGHAPALNVPTQLEWVAGFIDQHETAEKPVRSWQRAVA
jgi:pimeloyl-ACP methyl ester carboxylesterase